MKSIIDFINEKQNFLIKGHTKKQNKTYKLYRWFGQNYFAHLETEEDIENIMQNESNKKLVEEQKDVLKSLKEECGNNAWYLMRPSKNPPYVYIYFESNREAKNNIYETDLTVTAEDFNYDYWTKNKLYTVS